MGPLKETAKGANVGLVEPEGSRSIEEVALVDCS